MFANVKCIPCHVHTKSRNPPAETDAANDVIQ